MSDHRSPSRDPLQPIRELQKELEDSEGAVCLAASTGRDYEEGAICGSPVKERRHTISKKAYLKQMSKSGRVLSTLPINASHIAHYTFTESRKTGKRQLQITHLPPKPTSIDEASTWRFACQDHDARFMPIDKGIVFPKSHEYTRITTDTVADAMKEFEEALFLMAYRSLLSSLSILRGLSKTLSVLRVQKGNHPEILRHMDEVRRSRHTMAKNRHQYDKRFAGLSDCNMTHHFIAAQSHTRLAMSKVMDIGIVNVLPGRDTSRIVVSHLTNVQSKGEEKVENWIANAARALSDHNRKRPFIDLIAGDYDAYISPADYENWSKEERDSLERSAAASMNALLAKYNAQARRRILLRR